MVDGQLRDSEAPLVGEHRQEPVQLAIERKAPDDVGMVGLQTAVHVVQTHP